MLGVRSFVRRKALCVGQRWVRTAPEVLPVKKDAPLNLNRILIPEIAFFDDKRTEVTDKMVVRSQVMLKLASDDQIYERGKHVIERILENISAISNGAIDTSERSMRELFIKQTIETKDVVMSENFTTITDLHDFIIKLAKLPTEGQPTSTAFIPKFLKFLMRTGSSSSFKSVELYNAIIAYFLEVRDLEFALGLFYQMEENGFPPNTLTYNLFLRHLRDVKLHGVSPLVTAHRLLRYMNGNDVPADISTWILTFGILPDAISRQRLIAAFKEKNLPFGALFTKTILAGLQDCEGEKLIEFLKEYPELDNESALVHEYILSRFLVVNEDPDKAWEYLAAHFPSPSTQVMNLFVSYYCKRRHIADAIMVLRRFRDVYDRRPDKRTFHLLFNGLLSLGYWKHWRQWLRVVYTRYDNVFGHAEMALSKQVYKAQRYALKERLKQEMIDFKAELTEKEQNILKWMFLTKYDPKDRKRLDKILPTAAYSLSYKKTRRYPIDKYKSIEFSVTRQQEWLEQKKRDDDYIREHGLASWIRKELVNQEFINGALLEQLTESLTIQPGHDAE